VRKYSKYKMKIFVSSTYDDLIDERKSVQDALHDIDIAHTSMEYFVSDSRRPLEYLYEQIDQCEALILILGWVYGSCPPGEKVSYTELEYRYAVLKGKDIFVFIKQKKYLVPGSKFEVSPKKLKKLNKFKKALENNYLYSKFSSPQELKYKVRESLRKKIYSEGNIYDQESLKTKRAEYVYDSLIRLDDRYFDLEIKPRKKKFNSISVVVLCYNSPNVLNCCLQSLLNRTVLANEIICIDDGSSMELKGICEKHGAIFVKNKINKSIALATKSHSRNLGTQLSRSELIVYLDSDIVLLPRTIEWFLEAHNSIDKNIAVHPLWTEIPEEEHKNGYEYVLEHSNRKYIDIKNSNQDVVWNDISELIRNQAKSSYKELGGIIKDSINTEDKFTKAYDGFVSPIELNKIIKVSSETWQRFPSNVFSIERNLVVKAGCWDEGFFGWGEEDSELNYRLAKNGVQFVYAALNEFHAFHLGHKKKDDFTLMQLIYNAQRFLTIHPEILKSRSPIWEKLGVLPFLKRHQNLNCTSNGRAKSARR
jgi:glycosyltransferase involved in cell wall biosynthesis